MTAEVSAPRSTACAFTQSFGSIFVVVFKKSVLEKETDLWKKSLQTFSKSFLVSFDSFFYLITVLFEWLVLILHKFSILSFLFSCFTDNLEECAGKNWRKRKPFIIWKEVVISSSSDLAKWNMSFWSFYIFWTSEPSKVSHATAFWGIILFHEHSYILFHCN